MNIALQRPQCKKYPSENSPIMNLYRQQYPINRYDLNLYQHEKNFDPSNLEDFVDYKTNVTYKMNFDKGRVENHVGKGENAGCLHLLLFPQCFQRASLSGSLIVGIV